MATRDAITAISAVIYLSLFPLQRISAQQQCIFGPECVLPCRCEPGIGCDTLTGYCLTNQDNQCRDNYPPLGTWTGPGCQIGNIAYAKSGISTNHVNNNTVVENSWILDGSPGTCAFIDTTDAWENPMVSVDLESQYIIKSVNIYSKLLDGYNRVSFRAKFRIELSNSQTFSPSVQCEEHCGVLSDSVPNTINCEQIADPYQFIRLKRASIESDLDPRPNEFNLCEISVIGHSFANIDCDKCLLQSNNGTCGNGIWCEECASGFEPPDCRPVPSTTHISRDTSTTMTSSPPYSSTRMTSSLSSTVNNNSNENDDIVSSTISVLADSTELSKDSKSSNDNNEDTSVQLIIFTVAGIFVIVLVTLTILGICFCIRRNRHLKHMANTPNSTLTRRTNRRSLEGTNGYPLNNGFQGHPHNNDGYQFDEDYVNTSVSRHSSMLNISVMDTITEEREKESSKHSSTSSLHSSNVNKNDGSNSMNGSIKRYCSNRSL